MKMGLSLKEVIGMSTANASSVIGMGERIGTLKKGAEGDAVVMQIEKGEFTFWDVLDKTRGGRERLKTVAVFKGGKLISKS